MTPSKPSLLLSAAITIALLPIYAHAELTLTDTPTPGTFALVSNKHPATLIFDPADAIVVAKTVALLKADIQNVTGISPATSPSTSPAPLPPATSQPAADIPNALFIGTLGHSPAIDAIIRAKKIDVSPIAGQWESYLIVAIENPLPNVAHGLLIIGSDRRGTAYGTLAVSEKIGISPWNWWADVPAPHRDNLFLATTASPGGPAAPHVQGPPSVKYRGIFINDEDWGMQPWAAKTFEPETHDIGPKTYAKVFELLLRLKANFCWPAMHDVTKAFNIYPANRQVADDWAIVMGSSHCEQLLRNNVTEWVDAQGRVGEAAAESYNWVTNRAGIVDYWGKRLEENGKFENVYTLGLRGVHDSDMAGGGTGVQKAQRLNEVMAAQRDLLKKYVNPNVSQVPQILCPYKETLTYYQNGAVPPEDVTMVWADDNHGYIRQLSTAAEQKRGGGSGVYYHISYWGRPHDYLWLCTTPPSLVWEELSKAYDYNARNLWVINVGDIKPSEIDLTLAMTLAYDIKKYSLDNIGNYLHDFATQTFGPAHAAPIAEILRAHYQLNYQRKPEHLGFNTSNPVVPIKPTEFSDEEITARLAHFAELNAQLQAVKALIPPEQADAFYELVYYPVYCAGLQNEKMLQADMNHRFAASGMGAAATAAAEKSKAAYDAIQAETARFNNVIAGGKWKNMMSANPHPQDVFKLPAFATALPDPTEKPTSTAPASSPGEYISIAAEHFTRKVDRGASGWRIIPALGRLGDSIAVYPTTTPSVSDPKQWATQSPALEYDFTTDGPVPKTPTVTVEAIPTHRINPDRGLRYAIAIDDETPQVIDLETAEFSAPWNTNVLRGSAFGTTKHAALASQKHTLRIYMVDPGVVLDHIVIDFGGRPKSYLPPPETPLHK